MTNPQGNHGEDAKEYWWHLDATPTHSYAEYLYRYLQAAYPYTDLVAENGRRGKDDPEYELSDTGVLAEERFFDVTVVHAKDAFDDLVVEVRVINHGPEAAPLDVVPQLWFRNTWAWGRDPRRPTIVSGRLAGRPALTATHAWLGTYHLLAEDGPGGEPALLLCDNETNLERLWGPDAATAGRPQPAHPRTPSTTRSCTATPRTWPTDAAPRRRCGGTWTPSPPATPWCCGSACSATPPRGASGSRSARPMRWWPTGGPRRTRSTPR